MFLVSRDELQNKLNSKSVWYRIGELLNVFEDSAQRERTIVSTSSSTDTRW